ncbi:hypothetical protein PG985_008559 [Apiospora marii]|uniref:2EXR domain-containing protein n=1 Tax=Apiospora marii TaxID=335849 RepID=A0ABR1R339_9PEZI
METEQVVHQGKSIPYLPAEIRLAIWKEVASKPQVVFIDFTKDERRIRPCIRIDGVVYSQASILFFINHETRQIALEIYRVCVYLHCQSDLSWLLAENDRVLLKDMGWGWRTDGWGFGKYASAGSNRNYLRHEEPGQPQAHMYKVATDYADAKGPRPFGLPADEELLSQSVANVAQKNDIARYSLRKLVAKPMEQHLTRRHKYELNEPRVMARISAGNTAKPAGGGSVTKQYLMPEEAYAAVTKVFEPRFGCQFHNPRRVYRKIMRLLYDTA